jgi:AcrR family transcriptional regulator
MAMKTKPTFARDKLSHAFSSYLKQTDHTLDTLTVDHLATLAKINRVTFYRNFASLLDFLKWFLLKDLIFKVDEQHYLPLEVALKRIFDYIDLKRQILQPMMHSSYGHALHHFIEQEAAHYQLFNVQRIDEEKLIRDAELKTYVRFYARGIAHLIMDYIINEETLMIPQSDYIVYCARLVKNYIETLLERVKNQMYLHL